MPNGKCAAAFCNNRREEAKKRKLDLIFHAFPAGNEQLKRKWIAFCGRPDGWTPFKTDAICSVHFRREDYQMAKAPMLRWSKNLRRLHVDAYPSVREGAVMTISKKQQLDEEAFQQRLEELYRQNNPAEPELLTDVDHTYYSGGMAVEELEDEPPLLERIVYRLQTFPSLCALCYRAIDDEQSFTPFASYCEALQSTVEQKFDEITGDVMDEEDRASIHHLLPDKVCGECLEFLIQFHHYQRQLQCLKKFSTGMAQLLRGNREPLEMLYATQGEYLANVLKNLNICNESEEDVTLERLELEVTTYGQMQKIEHVHHPDHETNHAVEHTPVKIIPASYFQMDGEAPPSETRQHDRSPTVQAGGESSKSNKWICPFDEICREWFLDRTALQQHIRDDHKIFKCRTCGCKMKFYDLFKKHIESHDIARALLLSHSKSGSSNERKRNEDEKDGKVHRSEELLRRSKRKPVGSGNYICCMCFRVFINQHNYNNHKCCLSRRTTVQQQQEHAPGLQEEMEVIELDKSELDEHDDDASPSAVSNIELLSIEILQ